MTLVCWPRRAERTEAVDDDEAPDWNDPEMGKTRQWSRRRRGVGNLTGSGAGWAYTRQRITGGAEWRDGLAVGGVAFRWGAQNNAAGRRRLEQAVPAALGEEDERLKKNAGRWM